MRALNWPLNYILLESVLRTKTFFCTPLLLIFPIRQRVKGTESSSILSKHLNYKGVIAGQ